MPYRNLPALRIYLLGLVLAALVPMAVFAALVANSLLQHEAEIRRLGVEERTRALLTAVDNQLKSSTSTLRATGVYPIWQEIRSPALRLTLQALLETQQDWATINVATPDRQQILNIRIPEGEALPRIPDADPSFEEALQEPRPVVGDVVFGPSTRAWDFAVRTSVSDASGARYVLSAVIRPEQLDALLSAQEFPPGWIADVFDRQYRIVARFPQAAEWRGRVINPAWRAAFVGSANGWTNGTTWDGIDSKIHFVRSAETGWTVALAVPANVFSTGTRQAALILGGGFALALSGALVGALVLARAISRPIQSLERSAHSIRNQEPAYISGSFHIKELYLLADAFRLADEAVQERQRRVENEKDALQAADVAKDRFLAMLAHELRNPLAAVRSAAYILKQGGDSERARRIIERQSEHMARLVDDLLDVARIAIGRLELKNEPVNLNALTKEVVDSMTAAGKFAFHPLNALSRDAWVSGDPDRLRQVVFNLLDNAVKYSPRGARVQLEIKQADGAAVMEVIDEGPGLSSADAERIFNLFVQLERPKNEFERDPGMGVGLGLAKQIIERHGGQISVQSNAPHPGSRFIVSIPALAAGEKIA